MKAPIKAVARSTGLSQHVLRIWEKRYAAVVPDRTPTGRRIYSDEQVQRLIRLREATELGHSIGTIASLPDAELEALVRQQHQPTPSHTAHIQRNHDSETPGDFAEQCIAAIKSHDLSALNAILDRAALNLGYNGLLRKVISKVAQRLGDLWETGEMRIAHEHFGSAAIRSFVLRPERQFARDVSAPAIVVTTPQGQLHELGAVLVAGMAAEQGWRSIYLGPSLPAVEIAAAAKQIGARAIGLSLVYPSDDPALARELTEVRRLAGPKVAILAGGKVALAYRDVLREIDAEIVDLPDFSSSLARLRSS